ncbi:hypothetical protein K9L97_00870 [Candidatus Woesearchaeota archaeon]|nr:hypothetical protein [Candidatus Woesearchaeota archaeon]
MNKKNANNSKNNEKKDSKAEVFQLTEGDYFKGIVKITRKVVPGPVIFVVTDGTGMIDAKIKDSDFEENDVVYIEGKVSERAGKLQIDIDKIKKEEKDFDSILDEKANPDWTSFSIKSDRFEIMKDHMLRVAKKIRKAVLNNRPIIIRHHNDSDGINSGLAIEQSIKGLMKEIGVDPSYNLYRSPSKAPFYEVTDVFKDLTMIKRLEGFDQINPLLLVLDNGSTPEDVFGMKTMSLMGVEVIVIDHHNPVQLVNGKTAVCPYLVDHVNPYLYGLDSQTSAGMLCYEISRMIYKGFDNPLMPAIAAITDRCDISETKRYIENAGKTREELGKMGVAIDFMAYHFKFDPGKGVFEEIYKKPDLVDMINEKVKQGTETQLQSTLPYLRTQEINGVIFSHIDLEKYTLRFTFPAPGRVIGAIHDKVVEDYSNSPVVSVGHLSDMIIIRANQLVLPVQKIIERLQKEFPEANVDGGGHEQAGTIKFVSAHLTEILERIKQMLKERKTE